MNGAVDLTGYHLSFDAEMTTPSDMAFFSTSYNNGDRTLPTNSEAEFYAPYSPGTPGNPYTFENGELTITATPTPAYGLPYTSGLLTTGQSFYQNQGYFEIRAEMPKGAGFWPAFWMYAGDGSAETDIVEQPNVYGISTYYNSVKTSTYSSGVLNNTPDESTGYHTYGYMWTATSIQFTFDGNYIGSAAATPAVLANTKMYLLANLAVGGYGSWPGVPGAGTSAQYKIDYIRAFSNDPSVPVWYSLGAISSPDGVDTTPHLSGATLPPPPPPPAPVAVASSSQPTIVLGSGLDVLALQVAEDAYAGDAQFTVSVDGTQIGGVLTATAIHGAGATQAVDVLGSFGPGKHTATVNFLNDVYGGTPTTDRNLFVTQASIDNTAVAGGSLAELSGGPQSFTFQGAGAGTADTLTIGVSEDAWQGDAQYTVSVDGKQVGGVYTTTASHAAGQINQQTISGSFGKGAHTVGVTFINDAYAGTPTTDRNLYVNSVSYDGAAVAMTTITQYSNGTASIAVPATAANPSILTLHMAEDAYQGDAQFTVAIDGKQVGGTQAVTAANATGATQAFSFASVLTAGSHDVAVSFLNDSYGGSPSLDRNLYVAGAELNAAAQSASSWTAALNLTGTQHFSLVVPS